MDKASRVKARNDKMKESEKNRRTPQMRKRDTLKEVEKYVANLAKEGRLHHTDMGLTNVDPATIAGK
jgi:hypothetical protein